MWKQILLVAILSVGAGAALLFASAAAGLLLYAALDSRMSADALASFAIFFLPFAALGAPAVVTATALLARRRRPAIASALYLLTLLLGALGFAGFWVGAMGI